MSSLDIDITFRYIRYKDYIVLHYWPTKSQTINIEHLFLIFSKVFLYVLIPIQKQRNYFKHPELSVFSVLDLAL
jgi:hypothetical protein